MTLREAIEKEFGFALYNIHVHCSHAGCEQRQATVRIYSYGCRLVLVFPEDWRYDPISGHILCPSHASDTIEYHDADSVITRSRP